uniref:Uncharacterized protein n=1 Tax=Arundo donax TaxID=35708 RepID=A0A0A9G5W6_ARUDO
MASTCTMELEGPPQEVDSQSAFYILYHLCMRWKKWSCEQWGQRESKVKKLINGLSRLCLGVFSLKCPFNICKHIGF